ncbi:MULTISPECIES: polysialyltransferase family glycosyltransferase [unclassified Vibrio]|uniref:polysialyltransferase family glycosyltransferase n=1 Tax=unclassified Vibrio TaxID=2614977 RepID=UPI000C81F823|nr:polysialyltransferase family glycosyltransferase [Vibrio sp. 10N.261.54.E10]PMK13557.1 hypothetical protein BCU07_06335 [Vibrio sp. 10N.261.54.E10]
MIYYYALSSYQVLGCISHKLKYHYDDQAVILVSKVNYYHDSICYNLEKTGIFKEVHAVDDNLAKSYLNRTITPDEADYDDLKSSLSSFRTNAPSIYPIEFATGHKYYTYLDHWPLGILLKLNDIPYSFLEDGAGMFFRYDRALDMLKSTDDYIYRLTIKLGLIGRNPLVENIYLDTNSQPNNKNNEDEYKNLVDFNLEKVLDELSLVDVELILSVFGAHKQEVDEGETSTLFLTQNFVNLNLLSMEEQKNLFTLLVDYFSDGNQLYIKPHPFDFHPNYDDWFDNAIVIDKKVPSELLRFIIPKNFDQGLTASSTGIHALSNIIGKSLVFDDDIHIAYTGMHRLFVTLSMLKFISADKIVFVNTKCKQILNFNQYFGLDIDICESIDSVHASYRGSLVLESVEDASEYFTQIERLKYVDNIFILNSEKSDMTFLPNVDSTDFYLYHQVIQAAKQKNDGSITISEEDVFVMSRNKKSNEELLKFELEKYFSNSNEQIRVSYNIDDQYLSKRFNRALVRSLEARILEQEKLISKLKNKEII